MFYLVLQTTQVVEIVTALFVFHIHLQFSNTLQTYKTALICSRQTWKLIIKD